MFIMGLTTNDYGLQHAMTKVNKTKQNKKIRAVEKIHCPH